MSDIIRLEIITNNYIWIFLMIILLYTISDLVYLLNYEYEQRGVIWFIIKKVLNWVIYVN